MEFLPTVFEHTGELTGECLPRAEVIKNNAWCQTTSIFVLDSLGRVLCHQRSMQKDRLPGVWMTHLGGHVGQGETHEENALKELFEEAGLRISRNELLHWRTAKIDVGHVWAKEFVTLLDLPTHALKPQPGEVDGFAWMNVDEILNRHRMEPHNWCIGSHDFTVEYQCMRAVLTAGQHLGSIHPSRPIHAWTPLTMSAVRP